MQQRRHRHGVARPLQVISGMRVAAAMTTEATRGVSCRVCSTTHTHASATDAPLTDDDTRGDAATLTPTPTYDGVLPSDSSDSRDVATHHRDDTTRREEKGREDKSHGGHYTCPACDTRSMHGSLRRRHSRGTSTRDGSDTAMVDGRHLRVTGCQRTPRYTEIRLRRNKHPRSLT
jgi:hypothetical protein